MLMQIIWLHTYILYLLLAFRMEVVAPSSGIYDRAHIAVGKNDTRTGHPSPAQEGASAFPSNLAMHEWVSGILSRSIPSLCGYKGHGILDHVHLRVKVQGLSPSENEINGAFNVAILEEMFAPVVTQRVLEANQSAFVECSFGPGDPQCQRLTSYLFSVWLGRRILSIPTKNHIQRLVVFEIVFYFQKRKSTLKLIGFVKVITKILKTKTYYFPPFSNYVFWNKP